MNSSLPRAWITGAGGLIGHALASTKTSAAAGFEIIPLSHQDLELTDFAAVAARFRIDQPDLIIHCAALSKTPDCQAHPADARQINVAVTKHLATLAEAKNFIFFSTDLVFDGKKGHYTETDAVNPLSVYGETKAEAEQMVMSNPRHTVIRTSLNSGASPKRDSAYNEQWQMAWKRGEALRLFVDEFRSPISATVTAMAVWELAAGHCPGLYHVAGAERLSRFAMGQLAAERHSSIHPQIIPTSIKEYRGAPRPPDSSLNCEKAQKFLSFPLPGFARYLNEHPEEPY